MVYYLFSNLIFLLKLHFTICFFFLQRRYYWTGNILLKVYHSTGIVVSGLKRFVYSPYGLEHSIYMIMQIRHPHWEQRQEKQSGENLAVLHQRYENPRLPPMNWKIQLKSLKRTEVLECSLPQCLSVMRGDKHVRCETASKFHPRANYEKSHCVLKYHERAKQIAHLMHGAFYPKKK